MKDLIYLVPGFISYIVLRPFGIFNFYDNFDRQLTLIILSLINSGISTWLFGPGKLWQTLVTSALITVLYFVIFTYYPLLSQKISDRLKVPLYDNKSTLESVVAANTDTYVYSITFDFEDKFISSGYVKNIDNQGNYQMGLYDNGGEQVLSIEKARKMYAESFKNTLIVDSKNKTKTYLIIS